MSVSAIRIPANGSLAKAAVIFLHGLGDSGDGWSWLPQLVSQSKLINDPINYVFPNAPKIPVTINMDLPCQHGLIFTNLVILMLNKMSQGFSNHVKF